MSQKGVTKTQHERLSIAVDRTLVRYATSPDLAVSVALDLRGFQYESDVNGDCVFEAASLLKLPLAMTLEIKASRSDLDLRATHSMEEILARPIRNSLMRGLVNTHLLSTEELIRLMLISSDELAAHQLRTVVHEFDVNALLDELGFSLTRLSPPHGHISVAGTTTASEALRLVKLATNCDMFPITAGALACSTMYSRIPLGVSEFDVEVAHKTGSLPGVAHDVAELITSRGKIYIALLSRNQIDTVIAGYRMGHFVNELLRCCGVSASSSLSVV